MLKKQFLPPALLEAQRTQRKYVFIAFAETPKAINFQPVRQWVQLVYKIKVPDRAEYFSFVPTSRNKRKVLSLCALRVSSEAGVEIKFSFVNKPINLNELI
jgi:hypothetical protein